MKVFDHIRKWGLDRGITNKDKQLVKLMEEVGELACASLKNDRDGITDAIGDCVVVLTILADIHGLTIEDCIKKAYMEIKDRTGKTTDGVFYKM